MEGDLLLVAHVRYPICDLKESFERCAEYFNKNRNPNALNERVSLAYFKKCEAIFKVMF